MTTGRPLIGAAIIVKNEADHLRRCLGSIRAFCDEIVVVDTGSTDDTVQVAEEFGARVLHKPWRNDFAASRNMALDAITAEWVLYVDADEELVMADVAAVRSKVAGAETVMACGLRMHSQANWTPYLDFRMWRHDSSIRFTGEIHESTMDDVIRVANERGLTLEPIEIDIVHHGYEGDLTKKHQRNLPLILAEIKVHPEKINLWTHLGRIHWALGRLDLAEQAFATGVGRVERFGRRSQFDVQVFAALADLMLAQNRDASDIIRRGRVVDTSLKTFDWLDARAQLAAGDYVRAIELADGLLATGERGIPDDGVAYNLDMFSAWPRQLKIDCLFRLMRFGECAAMISSGVNDPAADSYLSKLLDVCTAVEEWSGGEMVREPIARPVLDDVTVVVPVRIESADRLANVVALIRSLRSLYDVRILVGSEQPESLRGLLPDDVEIVGVDGSADHPFHMTRVVNRVALEADTPIRIHLDTDSLVPPSQLLEAVERIRQGTADMVIPFTFGIGVVQTEREGFSSGQFDLDRLQSPRPMVGVPPGLCQVWSAEAFARAGTENEFMVGWGPDDAERLARLEILGMRVERVAGPVFHMDHTSDPSRNEGSEYHAISAGELSRIRRMGRAELEVEVASWPWRHEPVLMESERLDARDLTVLIPVRIDTPDRLRNLVLCTKSLLSLMDCRVIVAIGEPGPIVGLLDERVEVLTVEDPPTRAFHRTRIINDAAHRAVSDFVAVIDTDVVLSHDQWCAALDSLRSGASEMVYPYDGRMLEVPFAAHGWLERGELDRIPVDAQRLIEPRSVGGCYLMRRDVFMGYGMENETFISWGFEDDERLVRAYKLGVRVARVTGPILHVAHRRGPDSRADNPYVVSNGNELQRVKDLTNSALRDEVSSWAWTRTAQPVMVLVWNDLWHDVRELVDLLDRSVEITRDRSRSGECSVVVVGLSNLDRDDLPPPGPWIRVLLSREAGAHVPGLDDASLTSQFEIVSSHRRSSDLWAPYIPPDFGESLLETVPAEERHSVLASAWISSSWDASGRSAFLAELMLHMQVDSYGRRHKNTGDSVVHSHVVRRRIASQYRFCLAFENAREEDYVTEKFFDPLLFGSVPVYLGAPNVADFAPGEHSYIDASEFRSPRELADFLTTMSDDEYSRYHDWRTRPLRAEFVEMLDRVPRGILSPLIADIRRGSSPVRV